MGEKCSRLTSELALDNLLKGSPKGGWIALDCSGTKQLHLMDENGSSLQKLTFEPCYLYDWF